MQRSSGAASSSYPYAVDCITDLSLHLLIQTAAANERLGRFDEACRLIGLAAAEAMPDGLIMPFVENYTYIGGLLRDAVIGYAEPLNESANHPDKSAVRPSITHECTCSLSRAADFLREVERLGTEYVVIDGNDIG